MLPKYVPVMKGTSTAFTCLGNWYDLADPESLESLHGMLLQVSKRDLRTGLSELFEKVVEEI